MEYEKINNLLLSEDNESEVSKANRANENMLELIVYLIRIMKINQLDLKHPC